MGGEDSELDSVRETVRRLMASSYGPARRRELIGDPRGIDESSWRVITDQLGLLGLGIPEEYGGAGAGAAITQVVAEELGAALYSGPYLASAGLAAPALLCAGDEPARAEFLPRIADGSLVATLAITEAKRGWGVSDIATAAFAGAGPDGQWAVRGSKDYVLDAAVSGVAFVSARFAGGVGLFAIGLDASGVTVLGKDSLDLTRRLSSLRFEDAPARLVSGAGDASGSLAKALDLAMVTITGEQVGGARASLELAVAYAAQREQFGSPIGAFQAIKHLCADMLTDIEAASALAHRLARAVDAGEVPALHASVAKALCSETFFTVAARMIQIHGGIGFTWEHDAHLYYRRAKAMQLLFGDPSWHRGRVAELLDY